MYTLLLFSYLIICCMPGWAKFCTEAERSWKTNTKHTASPKPSRNSWLHLMYSIISSPYYEVEIMKGAVLNSQTPLFFPRCCRLVISRIEWQRRQTVMRSPCCAHSGASYPPVKTTLPPSLHPFPWEMSPAVVGVWDNGGRTPGGQKGRLPTDLHAAVCRFHSHKDQSKGALIESDNRCPTPGACVWARPRPLCLPRSDEPGIC